MYYVFIQQLLSGTRTPQCLTRQIFALSQNKNIRTLKKIYLLVHLDNIAGGHWTFISISLGTQTIISYHDSIWTLNFYFERLKEPLAAFLGILGISNISSHYAMVPQQEDGCSCGIFTIAGILAHVHNTPIFEFHTGHVACCRANLLRSIIECKLIIHHSLVSCSPQ